MKAILFTRSPFYSGEREDFEEFKNAVDEFINKFLDPTMPRRVVDADLYDAPMALANEGRDSIVFVLENDYNRLLASRAQGLLTYEYMIFTDKTIRQVNISEANGHIKREYC